MPRSIYHREERSNLAEKEKAMKRIMLTLAATTAIVLGGLVWTNAAEARPWRYVVPPPVVRYYGPAYYDYGYPGYYYPGYPTYYYDPWYVRGVYIGGPRAGVRVFW